MRSINNNFLKNYRISLFLGVAIFLIYIIYFAVKGYKEELASFMVPMQIIVGIVFFISLYLSPKIKNLKQLLFCILLYNIIFSVIFRVIYLDFYNQPYGLAVDSYGYEKIGKSCYDESFKWVSNYLSSRMDIDDYGYSIYTILGFQLFGVTLGRWIILLSNSILITFSSLLLFKICRLSFNDEKISLCASAMWGFFPFMFITTSVGLKENVFCTIIMIFWFCAYKFFFKKDLRFLILSIFFGVLTFTFRKAITLMLILSLILGCIVNKSNSIKIKRLLIIGLCAAPLLLSIVVQALTGISMDKVTAITEARNNGMQSSVSGPLIQTLAGLFGPFPNFNRLVAYGLYHSSGLLFKSILSVFLMGGIFYVYKNNKYRYFPISLYYVFGLLMLILGGVALDMRYAITFYMGYIILSCYGMLKLNNKYIISLVQIMSIGIIFLYNSR